MKADVLDHRQADMDKDIIQELVQLARQDVRYFDKVFDHYFLAIHRYVLSRVGDQQAAEDIVSQTFLSALEALSSYREKGCFTAWLFTIARSKINDLYRIQKRFADNKVLEIEAHSEDILAKHVQKEELHRLRSLVYNLPEQKKELMRLRYVAELSFREIGKIIGKSEGAVKKATYRTLENLRHEMENGHA